MALLAEYALIPDVFDATSYSNTEVAGIHLQHLKEVMLSEGLVRDLRNGAWRRVFDWDGRPWHLRGKELLKKLVVQKRLRLCPSCCPQDPSTDSEWCREALDSHEALPLTGIVVTNTIAHEFHGEPMVASIDRLPGVPWWAERSSSVRLSRTHEAYEEHLRLVLQCANSIMFIDPHLDPDEPRYQDFISLLHSMAGRHPAPVIEIHRVCYVGRGRDRDIIPQAEWRSRFQHALCEPLQAAGLSAEVFIWDDFHDRYLITDLVGISVPNGFDTTANLKAITRWIRLDRRERDDVQREFDPAANRHKLRARFPVP